MINNRRFKSLNCRICIIILILFCCSYKLQSVDATGIPHNIRLYEGMSDQLDTILSSDELLRNNTVEICPIFSSKASLDSLATILENSPPDFIELDCKYFDSISVFLESFKKLPIEVLIIKNYRNYDSNYSALKEYNHLRYFSIRNSLISIIPIELFNLQSITEFLFEGTKINTIPKEISNMKNLERMSFIFNRIQNIDKEIALLPKIADITFGNEYFIDLDNLIDVLSNFNHEISLFLGESNISSIPSSINRLSCLKGLDLSNNHISLIPKEILGLHNLRFLSLCGNLLEIIPEFICELENLEMLYLRNNFLTSIPDCLKDKKSLEIMTEGNMMYIQEQLKRDSIIHKNYQGLIKHPRGAFY